METPTTPKSGFSTTVFYLFWAAVVTSTRLSWEAGPNLKRSMALAFGAQKKVALLVNTLLVRETAL